MPTDRPKNLLGEDEIRTWINDQIADLTVNIGEHGPTLARLARRHADTCNDAVRRVRRLRRSDPDWARQRRQEGEPLYRFWSDDAWELEMDIETVAEQLEKLEGLCGHAPRTDAALKAERLLRGLAKRSLKQFMQEAEAILEAAEKATLKARRNERLCSLGLLRLDKGVWARRATKLASLDRIGREADNCLKGSGHHARRYQERLLAREIDVWEVLGRQRDRSLSLRAVLTVNIKDATIEEMEGPSGSAVKLRYGQAIEVFVRRLNLATTLGLAVKDKEADE